MKKKLLGLTFILAVSLMACGNPQKTEAISDNVITQEAKTADSVSANDADDKAENNSVSASNVAEAADAAKQEIDFDSLVPVYADSIKDGVYDVDVDCSSSMFVIDSCKVTKEGDKLTAELTMGGKGYLYVYEGTGEEASVAPEEDYIYYTENANGNHVYTFEIEGFDIPIDLAAFSKKKEMWYERILIFKASSLSVDAYVDGFMDTLESLQISDGEYTVEVGLSGGSGRASIESPAKMVVTDGKAEVTIIWSSSNYDYMKIGDVQYDPVNTEGNSTFIIPVEVFNYGIAVKADTTAMSTPHEIDYILTFDSSSIK